MGNIGLIFFWNNDRAVWNLKFVIQDWENFFLLHILGLHMKSDGLVYNGIYNTIINLNFLCLVTSSIRTNAMKVRTITAAATDMTMAPVLTPVLLDTVIFVACVVCPSSTTLKFFFITLSYFDINCLQKWSSQIHNM